MYLLLVYMNLKKGLVLGLDVFMFDFFMLFCLEFAFCSAVFTVFYLLLFIFFDYGFRELSVKFMCVKVNFNMFNFLC